jgi:hypothetical protein
MSFSNTYEDVVDMQANVSRPYRGKPLFAKQYDKGARYIQAQIMDGKYMVCYDEDCTVLINAKRPDGEAKSFAGENCYPNDWVVVPITYWMTEISGTVQCDISLICGDCVLTTSTFDLEVQPAACGDGDVSQDDNVPILVSLISQCKDIETVEAERVKAEAARVEAETARAKAEDERASHEDSRRQSEANAKASAEAAATNATNAAASATAAAQSAESAANAAAAAVDSAKSVRYTIAVPADGWMINSASAVDEVDGDSTTYYNTVEVEGITVDTQLDCIKLASEYMDNADAIAAYQTWSYLDTQDGAVVFYSTTAPTANFEIVAVEVR